ncbi:MAG: peptidoglycan recognition protein family protein [Phycisphaerales bacterium]|nr:peptidoglycan recognition protein family protein [Phycisphaerales bacterium]
MSIRGEGLAGNPGDPAPAGGGLSRRELVGGGLVLGLFTLAGCNPGVKTTALPDPYWVNANPVVNVPPVTSGPVISNPNRPAVVVQQPQIPLDPGPLPGVMGRSQWTSRGVARVGDINPMNGVRRITIHHDGMPPVTMRSVGDVGGRIEQIRQSHVAGRGWADIGYHYVIDPQGRVWEGRNIRYQGAHVKDQNENNLGILVLGNFDRQQPTASQISALDRFVAAQMQRYRINLRDVKTHQERAPTECPGRNLQGYIVRSRSGGGQMALFAARSGLI